jgi:hypothetical protein
MQVDEDAPGEIGSRFPIGLGIKPLFAQAGCDLALVDWQRDGKALFSGTMAKKSIPLSEAAQVEELPPEEIRRRMERALRRAFTLPPKPRGRSPKQAPPRQPRDEAIDSGTDTIKITSELAKRHKRGRQA